MPKAGLGIEKKQRDLLLVLDTSGSMKSVLDKSSNMHQAVLAAYGIISYFESIEGQVALIEFSSRVEKYINWTKDYNEIRENLLVNGKGNTIFPINAIRGALDKSKNSMVTVLITDGDLANMQESIGYFRDYLYEDNKLYVFILGVSNSYEGFIKLKDIGAKVFQACDAKNFCEQVIEDL